MDDDFMEYLGEDYSKTMSLRIAVEMLEERLRVQQEQTRLWRSMAETSVDHCMRLQRLLDQGDK